MEYECYFDTTLGSLIRFINYKSWNGDYFNKDFFDVDLGNNEFDYVISVMALHHFLEKEKLLLYKRILTSLKTNGLFINSDYIIDDPNYEMERFEQFKKIQEEYPGQLFHFDIPFTEERERKVLVESGFRSIDKVYENKKTKVLVNKK